MAHKRRCKKKKKKTTLKEIRNPYAADAWNRSGSGRHTGNRKDESRTACRKKVPIPS
jgi:hypothetical protein